MVNQTLLYRLLSKQPQTSQQLWQQVALSPSHLSRWLKTQTQVMRIGKARATQYVLKRPIRHLGSEWPVYRVGADANTQLAGYLIAVYPHHFVWRDELSHKDTLYDGLPWFLWDVRPQGFLGRWLLAAYEQVLNFSQPQYWQDEDILYFLLECGVFQPSHWLIGEKNTQVFQSLRAKIDQQPEEGLADVRDSYVEEATKIIGSRLVYSSVAGEQPKFDIIVNQENQYKEFLVKFSPPVDSVNGQRWSDLLVAEHLALVTLAEQGIASAASAIVHRAGRTFLEVLRFDRTLSLGRLGIVSLEAVSNEFIGHNKTWDEQAAALFKLKKISAQDYQTILQMYAFGRLIANEDMHNGNLSFFLADDFSLSLAPVYDMLPMRYAPTIQGEVIARPPRLIEPTTLTAAVWPQVQQWARSYWQRVSQDSRVSPDFQQIARQYLT